MPIKKNINEVLNSTVLTEDRKNMGRRAARTFVGAEIPDNESTSSVPVVSIPLEKIKERDINQFSYLSTVELEESIYEYTLINPISVFHQRGEEMYTISSGHRRFKAFQNLHKRYPDDPRFASIDCRVYILTDNKMELALGSQYITKEQEEAIYKESNLLSRQLTYADVAHQIRQIVSRLDDKDYKERLKKAAEAQGIKTYSEPDRTKLIISVLSSQNYHGWKTETIRQYIKVYDSGNEKLLDRIESDPNYKVHTAYKEMLQSENHTRARKTNKITALKRTIRAVEKESEQRIYSDNDIQTINEMIEKLQSIVEKNETKKSK